MSVNLHSVGDCAIWNIVWTPYCSRGQTVAPGQRPPARNFSRQRGAIEETDAAFARLKVRCRGEIGRLTIGVYASLSTGNLRATLVEYHRRFPDVDIHTVDGAPDRLLCALTSNIIDIAIMTTCCPHWDDRALPLWSERVIVAQSEHQLYDFRLITSGWRYWATSGSRLGF